MLNFEIAWGLDPGLHLAFGVRSARNRAPFDFAAGKFLAPGAIPALATRPLAELPPPFGCAYAGSYPSTPGVFWEPLYIVTIFDMGGPGPMTGTTPPPRVLFSFDVPFANGNSLYSAPPFYTY